MQIKKLSQGAKLPTYGTDLSAGADLSACLEEAVTIMPGQTVLLSLGFAAAVPQGYAGLVFARSGLASKRGLAPANKVGVIDSDYRGEICVGLYNSSDVPFTVHRGDRIAQLMFAPVYTAAFTEVDSLDETERGEGGFGSTGR